MNFIKDLSIDKVRNLAEDAINQAKPKTDVEARVYEVLSHKNWGASSSLMHEIARDTFDAERFYIITRLMWEGMENQRPAAWKIVFKALTLLEFLVKNGAERCVDDARNHGHVLRSLGKFNYYEGTVDRGLGVREKTKQILDVLTDDERIREERQRAKQLREKFKGNTASSDSRGGGGRGGGYDGYGNSNNSSGGGGGYGNGGIDSGGGYSGRYGGSTGGTSAATPTFAAMPAEKKKKKKKKKSISSAAAPAPAPAPEIDLFSFDDTPAPAPAPANDDFGAFQTNSAPANDEFDAFGAMRSATVVAQPDPFGAAPAAAPQQASFDAFGNTTAMVAPPPQAAPAAAAPVVNMGQMNNAFGGMNMGGIQQQPTNMMQPTQFAADDDDFGDFADAAPAPAPVAFNQTSSNTSADPLSKLISLDGLSKNKPKQTNNGFGGNNNNNPYGGNFGGNMNGGVGGMNPGMPAAPVVVSAGGSDAISSMFAPAPQQQQQPQQQKQQQLNPQMMNMMGNPQGMQGGGGGMTPQMMQQQQMRQMQQQMAGGMNPQMMAGNMQVGGMNPQMMGANNMQGGMNPQMMNQMGNMQGNMNHPQMMGMQGNMMNNQQQMMNQQQQQQMGGMGMNQQHFR